MNACRWFVWVIPLVSPVLAAQTMGFPASYRPVVSGYGVAVDAGGDKGGLRTVGATGVIALGHVTVESSRMALFNVSTTIARLNGEAGQGGGSAVGADVSLLGSFSVGVDRSNWGGTTRVHLPLAAALPLAGCADSNRIFLLYGVPLWSFERVSSIASSAWQPSWGSVSLGALLEFRSGVGMQLGVGGLLQHASSDPYRRVVVSIGMHFSPHGLLSAAKPAAAEEQGRRSTCSFLLAGD